LITRHDMTWTTTIIITNSTRNVDNEPNNNETTKRQTQYVLKQHSFSCHSCMFTSLGQLIWVWLFLLYLCKCLGCSSSSSGHKLLKSFKSWTWTRDLMDVLHAFSRADFLSFFLEETSLNSFVMSLRILQANPQTIELFFWENRINTRWWIDPGWRLKRHMSVITEMPLASNLDMLLQELINLKHSLIPITCSSRIREFLLLVKLTLS
jgi:hypothetical protein